MSEDSSKAQMMLQLEQSLDEARKLLERGDYKSAGRAVLPVMGQLVDDNNRSLMDKAAARILGDALLILGTCEYELESFDDAKETFEQGLDLATSLQDESLTASFLHELSLVAYKQGRLDEALRHCEESIAKAIDRAFVRIGQGLTPGYIDFDLNQLGGQLNQLAVLCQEAEQFDKAFDLLIVLKAHCERVYNTDLIGIVLNELGTTCFAMGRYAEGVRFFLDSISTKAKHGQHSAGISKSVLNLRVCLAKYPAALQQDDVSIILKEYQP